jgi:hypothetical protein
MTDYRTAYNAKMRRKFVLILYCICSALLLCLLTFYRLDDLWFHIANAVNLLIVCGLGLWTMRKL